MHVKKKFHVLSDALNYKGFWNYFFQISTGTLADTPEFSTNMSEPLKV